MPQFDATSHEIEFVQCAVCEKAITAANGSRASGVAIVSSPYAVPCAPKRLRRIPGLTSGESKHTR